MLSIPESTTNLLLSQFQEYIYLSKKSTSRFLHDQGRRETWPETVARYFDFFKVHLKEMHGYNLTNELRFELEMALLNMEAMPSMRCIMTAGAALERENISGYNCLGGDTLVTTKEFGIIPIRKLVGKTVHVVDGNGCWVPSECKSFGKQEVYSVKISDSPHSQNKIKATANHRWILRDGSEKLTNDLKNDDKLAFTKMPDRIIVDINSDDYRKGVVHGIVYGDGTASYKQTNGCSSKDVYVEKTCKMFIIRLCGRSRNLLSFFDNNSVSYPKSYNGDPVVYISDRSIDLKSLPNDLMTDEYKIGFIRGWFAADGSISQRGQVALVCPEEGKFWLNQNGPKYHFCITNEYQYPNETNLGKRSQPLFRLSFDRRWLTKEDFILDYKRDAFVSIDSEKNPGFARVNSISFVGIEEVFCFDVPTTHSFLLTKNLLTGNCAYTAIDSPKVFAEILYILMCGTGVGFSVERQYTNKLPEVPDTLYPTDTTIIVADSKLGWAKALNELISLLYTGLIPKWDLSKLRPAGSILKIFGGRSSGPDPLDRLFKFVVASFEQHKSSKLDSLACHDIACMVGECVVVGGVRRSAMISLSNLSDTRMRSAKTGQWWKLTPWRSISNNSAVYTDRQPPMETFMDEWKSLYDSKSGERGIFSRHAARSTIERSNKFRENNFGKNVRLIETDEDWGCNPCSEVLLRDSQFCNLSEVVIRPNDTLEILKRKVRIAAIFGTFQSTLTNFKFISKKWKDNTEDERLLGVSLTGIMDNKLTSGQLGTEKLKECLTELRKVVIQTNMEFAKDIGIPLSTASTSVKPSGTVSALNDTSSGIHARHAPFYLRTVRSDKKDPLSQLMIDQGVPYEDDQAHPESVYVFSFPMKSPKNAIFRHEVDAIKQLETWMIYQMYWTDHKPSVTVSVKENEWMKVGSWVFDNFEYMSGVSFLPFSDHSYAQAPFQDLLEDEYKEWMKKMPKHIDWSLLSKYETSENANLQGQMELACQGVSPDGEVGCVI